MSRSLWRVVNNRYVLVADIMGFRDVLQRFRRKDVYHALLSFRGEVKEQIEINRWAYGPGPRAGYRIFDEEERDVSPLLRFVQFSDSTFVFTRSASTSCYLAILTAAANLFVNAAFSGIALRGAIAKGIITSDFRRSIFFGNALAAAYELANEVKWYGIVEHRSVTGWPPQAIWSTLGYPETELVTLPTKRGRRRLAAVSWPFALNELWEIEHVLQNLCVGRPKRVRSYGEATVAFANRLLSKY
jgi:hypothetical protein